MNRMIPMATLAVLIAAVSPTQAAWRCDRFAELQLTLERNATDGDTEVVLFAQGQDEGLKNLVILAPDRERVVANVMSDGRGIGLREFHLESAEPPDLGAVLRSFPRGSYFFFGRTVTGECLTGTARLSHVIAPATTLLSPREDEIVPVHHLVLDWKPVAQAERYIIELNNEDTGSEYTLDVFPPRSRLAIPANLLERGSEYQFGVGVVTADGNVTFVERTFFTMP